MSLPFNRTSAQLKGNQSYPNKKILVSFVQVIDQGMGINCSLEWSSNVTDQILAQHLHYLHRIHKSDKSFHWRGKYFLFIRLSVHLSVHLPTLCVFGLSSVYEFKFTNHKPSLTPVSLVHTTYYTYRSSPIFFLVLQCSK